MAEAYVIEPGGDNTLHVWLNTDEGLALSIEDNWSHWDHIDNVQHVPVGEGYTRGEFTQYLSVIYRDEQKVRDEIADFMSALDIVRL